MGKKDYSVKKVLINSSVYSFTNILQKAISFFLLPLYTLYLTPGDYGLTALISSFTGFISLLITLGLEGAISRYYFKYKDDEEKVKQFLGTIIITVIFNCIVLFSLVTIFNQTVVNTFLPNTPFYPYIFIGLIATVTSPIYSLYQTILQVQQKARRYSLNSLCNFGLTLSLNIVLVAIFKLGAIGLLLAGAVASMLFSIMAIYSLIKNKYIILSFEWRFLKEALRYSLPLLPHIMTGPIANYVSKYFLNLKSTLQNIGLFNVASQFGSVIDIVQSSINSAYLPWFYNTMDHNRQDIWKIIKMTTYIFKGVCFIGVGLSLFSKEIIYIMTSSSTYNDAWKIMPIIALSSLFYSLYLFYSNTLFYNTSATRYIWVASMSGNVSHIIFSVFFTSLFGFFTPAIALLVQRIITALIVYFISTKLEPVKFELRKMLSIIFLFILTNALGLTFDLININSGININSFFYKICIFLVFTVILFYEDRLQIFNLTNKFIEKRKKL